MIPYRITRAQRKTAAIYVRKDGSVEVRCPVNMPAHEIDKFVSANRPLLEKKIAQTKEYAFQSVSFSVKPGDRLLFLGKEYPLEQVPFSKMGFDGTRFYVPENMPAENIKPGIIKIYKRLAEKRLKSKTSEYAKIMKVTPVQVKVNSAKTRWGSCSGKNSINFSWRLILADERCVDYVVIHELAHTAEHNHSGKFWEIVARYLPDYKIWDKRLKDLQKKLAAENWD
jgi:predicted metal-dependent hydrolase